MHPIERLRSVARASSVSPALAVRETANAMSAFADDPHALVTACRRMIDRHPTSAPLWWFGSRMLTAPDPRAEARRAAREISDDPTAAELDRVLPDGATVCIIGWPDITAEALVRRGDVEVLVVDAHGDGSRLASQLGRNEVAAVDVPVEGLGAAAASCDIVLLEASAVGPTACLATAGSRAAAAVARHAGASVWLVAGVGRLVPPRLWDALLVRAGLAGEPWDANDEIVPLDLVEWVVTPSGRVTIAHALERIDCPVAAELLPDRRDLD